MRCDCPTKPVGGEGGGGGGGMVERVDSKGKIMANMEGSYHRHVTLASLRKMLRLHQLLFGLNESFHFTWSHFIKFNNPH